MQNTEKFQTKLKEKGEAETTCKVENMESSTSIPPAENTQSKATLSDAETSDDDNMTMYLP